MRALLAALVLMGSVAVADDALKPMVVRERASATLMDGAFTFRVLKIRGYTIDVLVDGTRQTLKLGDRLSPDSKCHVVFEEISPETRIARFLTDCT